MDEIREILQVIAQSTQATTSAAEAVKKAVEGKKATTTDRAKLITKPNLLDRKSQEEDIKAFREWPSESEKYLSSVDEAYMKDLKGIHDKPNDSFDMDLAPTAEKTMYIKLYGLLASLMRDRALQLVKAVEDSNGLNKALKPTSKARGLALLGAATTWPAFSMNSGLQPQLLKLEEVFDEGQTRKSNSRRVETCYSCEMCRWTA